MSFDRSSAFNLTLVIGTSSPHIISTVSLKPPSWIFLIYSSFFLSKFEWHRCADSKKIELRILFFRRKFRIFEPSNRKFFLTICHIFSPKYTHLEHLLWCQFGVKYRIKMLSNRLSQIIGISFLYIVVDDYFLFHEETILSEVSFSRKKLYISVEFFFIYF